MGVKHKTPKVSGEKGFAIEWNEEHLIDSDINFNNFSGINVGEPINPSDIATKNYVDIQAGPTVGVPIGSIFAWLKNLAGTPSLPSGWVECSGQTLSDAGSPYNGQVIPNLNGANIFLRGSSTSGGVGGADTISLSVSQMPAHSHIINVSTSGDAMNLRATTGASGGPARGGGTLERDYSLITSTVGGNVAHENKPPYYNVVWIMRIK